MSSRFLFGFRRINFTLFYFSDICDRFDQEEAIEDSSLMVNKFIANIIRQKKELEHHEFELNFSTNRTPLVKIK